MRPLRRQTIPIRVGANARGVYNLKRKPELPDGYVYVETGDPDIDSPGSPVWQNGWSWLGTAYVGFRHGLDGLTEFVGTLDTTGATSGTVAFTLPSEYRGEVFSFITDLDLGSGTFNAARVTVSSNGDVTVYFPITP